MCVPGVFRCTSATACWCRELLTGVDAPPETSIALLVWHAEMMEPLLHFDGGCPERHALGVTRCDRTTFVTLLWVYLHTHKVPQDALGRLADRLHAIQRKLVHGEVN
jgi:hypothetical protein